MSNHMLTAGRCRIFENPACACQECQDYKTEVQALKDHFAKQAAADASMIRLGVAKWRRENRRTV